MMASTQIPVVGLRRSSDFRDVLRGGTRLNGRLMVLYERPGTGALRCGFVCSRAVGNAVVRNRARRLLREAWRGVDKPRSGHDLVFVARPEIRKAGMQDVRTDMTRTLRSLEGLSP